MYTLFTLPIHLFNANPHYVRISCLTIRKKNPRGWIQQSNKQTASITVRCPQIFGRSAAVAKPAG